MSEGQHDTGCSFSVKISPFFDGELPLEEARAVESHLLSCSSCAAELKALSRVSTVLKDATWPGESAGFRGRLRASLVRGGADALVRLAAGLTAAAAAVLITSMVYILAGASTSAEAADYSTSLAAVSLEMEQTAFPESPADEALARFILAELSAEEVK
ncbi:MAG: anti-sigma factor family protein [Planctomycetota bacterium]|jgi:anti-sigma factor RsiW